MTDKIKDRLDRRAVVAALLRGRSNAIVVSALGAATYDVADVGDHDRNFYLWGAMGGAAMIGLGLALAQPDIPVIVVTGDGEMLMGMGSFATLALQNPGNLSVVVLDNGLYGETGSQETHAAFGADLAKIAASCGLEDARTLTTMDDVETLAPRLHSLRDSPSVAVVKIAGGNKPKVMALRDGAINKGRLRAALGLPVE
ncbi:thiamine pyrophosphate-dependent enzyme [Pelagibius sp. Alg239-R121]|uniref:thiamine pyrophosphate-dependent enzyme n=1 Tax=Pelagibius sp. Alg239-R121 TaxID=2993448 RepID=UPI0024A6CEA2|nr:thiamine pyrophosphate-dependent enzyme [Pelagibius sp. Alg239-R121]